MKWIPNFKPLFLLIFRFYDKRDAEDALDAMDGRMLDGRELRVQMARYGRPTSPYRRRRRRYTIHQSQYISIILILQLNVQLLSH